jgi:ATP-dependent DNA helicase RecQ
LFERLRLVRRELADAASVPAFIIFSDATLRDLARRRPVSTEHLLSVHGIGQRKSTDFGERIISEIKIWCATEDISFNVEPPKPDRSSSKDTAPKTPSTGALTSFPMFDEGLSVEAVVEKMQRAPSTVCGYLEQYIAGRAITDPTRWVDAGTTQAIRIAATHNDTGRLRPIFEALHGQVSYENIRVVVACMKNVTHDDRPQ